MTEKKNLKDMTLEELWTLFPIVVVPHNRKWAVWADEEIAELSGILSVFSPLISHVGSTAIPDIAAKPIVDLLIQVQPEVSFQAIKEVMESRGYICMAEGDDRISFNKGYTPEGFAEKVFHIHVHRMGDNDEVLFRDYLTAHPETVREYEKLKLHLAPRYRHNRDGYTEAKASFVKRVVETAKSTLPSPLRNPT